MTIGHNIRRIRQARGMTQWQLSQAVGCTPGRILLIERGDRECSHDLIQAIAAALNVPESKLYGKQ